MQTLFTPIYLLHQRAVRALQNALFNVMPAIKRNLLCILNEARVDEAEMAVATRLLSNQLAEGRGHQSVSVCVCVCVCDVLRGEQKSEKKKKEEAGHRLRRRQFQDFALQIIQICVFFFLSFFFSFCFFALLFYGYSSNKRENKLTSTQRP